MHVAFQKRDPRTTLVPGCLVHVSFQLVKSTDLSVHPLRDCMRGEELALAVVLRLDLLRRAGQRLERDMQVREPRIQRTVDGDVPAHGDVSQPAQGEVGLPFETLDVAAQEVLLLRGLCAFAGKRVIRESASSVEGCVPFSSSAASFF